MMPEDIAQACHDGEGVGSQAVQGYKPVWMDHWMRTSYKSATSASNHLSIKEGCDAEQHDLLGGLEVAEDNSVNPTRSTRVAFVNEEDPEKSKKASSDPKPFPLLKLSRNTDVMLSLRRGENVIHNRKDKKSETEDSYGDDTVFHNGTGSQLLSTSAHAPPETETSVEKCQLLSEGILPTELLMKSPDVAEQKNLAVSTSVWNHFVKSASDMMPNAYSRGKTLMPSFTDRLHEIYQSSYNVASQKHFAITNSKYHSYSSLLIREKKVSSSLDPPRSSFSRWVQGGITHFTRDLTAGSDDGLYLVCDQHHKMQKYPANTDITNRTASLESTEPLNYYGGSSLVAQLPCSVHDVQTMKLYTSIDSVEESSRVHPKVSQTAHHFLMSKESDVNLSKRGQFLSESLAPGKFKGNYSNQILDFFPPMSDHAVEGVKQEALGSSMKIDDKENTQYPKTQTRLKNESSSETDTMDMDALQKNHFPGDVPLKTNKYFKDSQNSSTSHVAITSAGEKTKAKSVDTALPDVNQEPPQAPTMASPVVDRETSTSRTHSFDVELLLSHADEHAKSKSSACGNSSMGPDPSSRWVKRLKLCTMGTTHGTKSENIGETSSYEKLNNIFSKIRKGSKSSFESKRVYHDAEGPVVPDLPATVLTKGKSSFTEAKQTVEITLSHPWIQRWSHKDAASSQKRHELVELCGPKSSKTVLEEFQKKQFPSIAAMALMGKAMNSLNPTVLMKKGPVIVWNTKGF